MYLMSLISQVQEVFPDLGEGFIGACLSTYDNNVETVIDRLLTQSLPEHLASMDHTLPRYIIIFLRFMLLAKLTNFRYFLVK
jgi:hypothetical protein